LLAFWTSHSKYAQFSRFVFAISSLLRNVYCFVKKRVRLPYQKAAILIMKPILGFAAP